MPSISPFPSMPDTLISESGVLKLLHELKVHKAAGPDQIRPTVLRELSHIIHVAPILTLIYRRSYDTAQVPVTGKRFMWLQSSRKGEGQRLETIRQYNWHVLPARSWSIFLSVIWWNMQMAQSPVPSAVMVSEKRGLVIHSCWNLFMTLHVICRVGGKRMSCLWTFWKLLIRWATNTW